MKSERQMFQKTEQGNDGRAGIRKKKIEPMDGWSPRQRWLNNPRCSNSDVAARSL